MPESRLAPLRKALLVSATRKTHLAVGGTAILIALGTRVLDLGGQALPVIALGLGLVAFAAMVALDVTSPEFIRRANARIRVTSLQETEVLKPSNLRDPEIRKVYTNILESLENCRRVYDSSSPNLRASLEDGLHRSEDLVAVAVRAAKRSDAIRRHLDEDTPAGLTGELTRLHELAELTSDETARKDFLQAAEAKTKELETYRQLQGLRDRIHAQLKLIETSLDGLAAKLVKLEATDVTEAIAINESITENVRTMTSDVEILESTYEETMQELRL